MPQPLPWTDETTARAQHWWNVDLMSAADIAARLGITRGAFLGKMWRLKKAGVKFTSREDMSHRRKHPKPKPSQRPGYRRRSAVAPSSALPAKPAEPTQPLRITTHADDIAIPAAQRRHITFVEDGRIHADERLTSDVCRWPVGDPLKPDFFFCGGPAEPGLPYCACHVTRAYRPKELKHQPSTTGDGAARSTRQEATCDT